MQQQVRSTRSGRQATALSERLRVAALIAAPLMAAAIPAHAAPPAQQAAQQTHAPTQTQAQADAQTQAQVQPLPHNVPRWFRFAYPSALKSPRPMTSSIGIPPVLPQSQNYLDSTGLLGVYMTTGPVVTSKNAFFQSLGSNGRSCFSCHQPSDGMSVSTSTIQRMFALTGGRDPIFAPVDGSNCPSSVPRNETVVSVLGGIMGGGRQSTRDSRSLLLNKGLFRVFMPVPTEVQELGVGGMPTGKTHPVEFTISVVSDPYGCNTDPAYAQSADASNPSDVRQMISVYRRPRMSANMKFVTTPAFNTSPNGVSGLPVVDPATGQAISGNIMWDGREPSLESQAFDATMGHAQATKQPTAAQVAEMVAFEKSVYTAQSFNLWAGDLTQNGAAAGPRALSAAAASSFLPTGFSEYNGYPTATSNGATVSQKMRASIARGQALFNTKPITVDNVPGFNNAGVFKITNPSVTTCASCHGNLPSGSDPFPAGQRDIGIGGAASAFHGPKPATDLPIFKVSCKPGYTTAFYGTEVYTNDPALALISGKCEDVGRRSVPQLRALAARAPYFSDGSAPQLTDVVKVYDKRFNIGLTPTDVTDLANFLGAL